jgi:2-dehydropantoate 2-reductase
MRFGFVGAGSVGSILAAHLVEAGQEVHVVDVWKEHLDAILRDGLQITGVRELKARVHGGYPQIADLAAVRPDIVVLCVKASVLRKVLHEIEEILSPETPIVTVQEGLDTEELIGHTFAGHPILRFVANYGGNVLGPGKVAINFFTKPNHVGCVCKDDPCDHGSSLAEILTGVYLDTKVEADIKRLVWEKTILNASMSPVSAVTGLTMHEVMESSHTYRIVESLMSESIKVAARSGYDFGPGFLNFCMSYLEKGGPHKPSMLIDLESGRETEIDFINGRISYYGSLNNVPTPVNDMFTMLVKTLESRALHDESTKTRA